MPQPEKQLDVIKVTGLAANVERAKQGLLERVKELQAEQEDRVQAHTVSCLSSQFSFSFASRDRSNRFSDYSSSTIITPSIQIRKTSLKNFERGKNGSTSLILKVRRLPQGIMIS